MSPKKTLSADSPISATRFSNVSPSWLGCSTIVCTHSNMYMLLRPRRGWAMRQRILGSHTPPCHRRMVINSVQCFALMHCSEDQISAECCLSCATPGGYRMFFSCLGQLAPTTLPQCRGGEGGGCCWSHCATLQYPPKSGPPRPLRRGMAWDNGRKMGAARLPTS